MRCWDVEIPEACVLVSPSTNPPPPRFGRWLLARSCGKWERVSYHTFQGQSSAGKMSCMQPTQWHRGRDIHSGWGPGGGRGRGKEGPPHSPSWDLGHCKCTRICPRSLGLSVSLLCLFCLILSSSFLRTKRQNKFITFLVCLGLEGTVNSCWGCEEYLVVTRTKVSCSPTCPEKVLGNHLVLELWVILLGEAGLEKKKTLPEDNFASMSRLYYMWNSTGH